jgi:hypothetical protein
VEQAGYKRVPFKDPFEACCKTYLAPDRLVLFNNAGGLINIRESKVKAPSMDDAQSEAPRDSVGDLHGYVATEPGNSFMGPVKLLGVSRKDGNWIITASGRWKAEVTLDEKYEVVATRPLIESRRIQ